MMYTAESKNIKVSPRKMRLVVDGVKDMPIPAALATLSVTPQRAAVSIKKALESAMANAVHNGKVNKQDLMIAEMFVNEGITYKRFHYAGRGRTRPYKKRSSHLKVILGVKEVPAVAETPAVIEKPMKKKAKKGGTK